MRPTIRMLFSATAQQNNNSVVVNVLAPSKSVSKRLLNRIQLWTSSGIEKTKHSTPSSLITEEQTVVGDVKLDVLSLDVGQSITSKTILQLFALENNNNNDNSMQSINDNNNKDGMQIYSIQTFNNSASTEKLLTESRRILAESKNGSKKKNDLMSKMKQFASRLSGRSDIQNYFSLANDRLPHISLESNGAAVEEGSKEAIKVKEGSLKEIVLPVYDTDRYDDGRTLFEILQQSSLVRPVTGVYQLPYTSICIRPLPMAKVDRYMAPPSLIFSCNNDLDSIIKQQDPTTSIYRIGWTGNVRNKGQIMLRDKCSSNVDIDIRLCSATKPSSMFSEAQESLLAGSLNELQSTHVFGSTNGQSDPRDYKADCWIEFRATMKNPGGFLSTKQRGPKISKVPNIPYE